MTVLNCASSMPKYKDRRIVFSQLVPDDQNMSIGEHSNSGTTFSSSKPSSSGNKPTASSIAGAGSRSAAAVMSPKQQKAGKRPGRKPSKINERDKLERSRQSARECRARKKLRYQYLEELVINREKAVFALRDELKQYKRWCSDVDQGELPSELKQKIEAETRPTSSSSNHSGSDDDDTDIVSFSPYNDGDLVDLEESAGGHVDAT